jgi:hypothetical protein
MQEGRFSGRWRIATLLTVGALVGILVGASPASAHFTASISHIWHHIKPKADARYANAVPHTDKAKNANKVDGLDSTDLARGQVHVRNTTANDVTLGLHDISTIPGVGTVRASCGFTDIPFDYKNLSGGTQDVVQERAGAYTEYESIADQADTPDTAASEPNGVTFHVSTAGRADTALFVVHANIAGGTAGPCIYDAVTVESVGPPADSPRPALAPPGGRTHLKGVTNTAP